MCSVQLTNCRWLLADEEVPDRAPLQSAAGPREAKKHPVSAEHLSERFGAAGVIAEEHHIRGGMRGGQRGQHRGELLAPDRNQHEVVGVGR